MLETIVGMKGECYVWKGFNSLEMSIVISVVVGIVAGILSGLISSFIFFIIMYRMKPKLEVADEVCLRDIEENEATLVIKIVNSSKSMLTNVRYDLYLEKRKDHENVRIRPIEPRKDRLWFITGYSKDDFDSAYATLISYRVNLSDIKQDDTSLSFSISAEHSVSGRKVCISKEYYKYDFVKNGMYHQGKDMRIIRA